jgi:hypothetical protein
VTSLLQNHLRNNRFRGGDAEALSYLKDTGFTGRMATPSPQVHLIGATLFLAVAVWGGIAAGRHSVAAGILMAAAAGALALMDLLPALWTLSHREYTDSYLAARSRFGNGSARLHPFLVLLGFPVLIGLAAAATPIDQGTATRIVWGIAGVAAGLVVGLLRVGRARRSAP